MKEDPVSVLDSRPVRTNTEVFKIPKKPLIRTLDPWPSIHERLSVHLSYLHHPQYAVRNIAPVDDAPVVVRLPLPKPVGPIAHALVSPVVDGHLHHRPPLSHRGHHEVPDDVLTRLALMDAMAPPPLRPLLRLAPASVCPPEGGQATPLLGAFPFRTPQHAATLPRLGMYRHDLSDTLIRAAAAPLTRAVPCLLSSPNVLPLATLPTGDDLPNHRRRTRLARQ